MNFDLLTIKSREAFQDAQTLARSSTQRDKGSRVKELGAAIERLRGGDSLTSDNPAADRLSNRRAFLLSFLTKPRIGSVPWDTIRPLVADRSSGG
jgi:hypothetical protein